MKDGLCSGPNASIDYVFERQELKRRESPKNHVLLYTSPVNSITSGVSRNKVGVLENAPKRPYERYDLVTVSEIIRCQRIVYISTSSLRLQCELLIMTKINFPDAVTPLIEDIHHFHDLIIIVLVRISTTTFLLIMNLVNGRLLNRRCVESQPLELVWTLIPALILVLLVLPSLRLLYLTEERETPKTTLKAIGHQWY